MGSHLEEHHARIRGSELADLRLRWDEAYEITWNGRFRAQRLDGSGGVDAETAFELNELLRDDYAEHHVAGDHDGR
ncbi:MAG: hypothetical protein ACRDPY_04280 [Streptosporangiaceae bacterium]